ncbi:MAG: amino acid adenylation domain-containing protein [Anaerolineae bacterium]
MRHPFSCFIVGEGTLPIRCAEVLLQRGHDILGIVSPDSSLRRWARERDIPHLDPATLEDLAAFLGQRAFDYLFSIVNSYILSEDILALPRRMSINYHDAPLPRYAGSHATSWAILARESRYGVSWHVATRRVDAGDILRQVAVNISAGETALSLNAKCYDVAVDSFADLVDELAADSAVPQPQNLEERTFFPLYKRPPAGCVIAWDQAAEDIDALARALYFGPYPNPLGLPKLFIGGDFLAISRLDVLDLAVDSPPGTIVRANDFLTISTATYQVALSGLTTLEGRPLPIREVVTRFALREGDRLDSPSQALAVRLTESNALVCRHEPFWVDRLATMQPIDMPYALPEFGVSAQSVAAEKASPQTAVFRVPVLPEVVDFLAARRPAWDRGEFTLSAFIVYLARLSGSGRFDVGFSADDVMRDFEGLESFFARCVPLRVDLDLEWCFDQVYRAVREQVEAVKTHGTYARDLVARYPALRPLVDPSGKYLRSVVLEQVDAFDEHRVRSSEFTAVISGDGTLHWVYDPNVYSEESIARMAHQFTILLRGLVSEPELRLRELPWLTESERQEILVGWNATEGEYRWERCVHDLIAEQVAQRPEAVAVVSEAGILTYGELDLRARRLAQYLQGLGVGPECVVGLCVERSLEMIVALLGIMKAGGAYVPLGPRLPRERIDLMLAETGAKVVLTQRGLEDRLSSWDGQVVCLDGDWPGEGEVQVDGEVSPCNLVYVIYTSGSTGQPKGVMVEHRSLTNFVMAAGEVYGIGAEDRVLQFASLSFDAAGEEIYPCLAHGGTLILRTEEMLGTAEVFWRTCRALDVSVVDLPTAYWHELVDQMKQGQDLGKSLRLVIIGGERADPVRVRRWRELVGNRVQLMNTYGPTEATVVATAGDVTEEEVGWGEVSIGRPLRNVETYVLDRWLEPVPAGVVGELYIGGAGLARGYLGDVELTRKRFVPHPYGAEGSCLYQTGDLVRYQVDGDLEFVGRVDEQVKVRGYRVEPGEIERVLRGHSTIREAVVMAREDMGGGKRLVAYVVPQNGSMSVAELRGYLGARLPDYMVPGMFVEMDNLPLMTSGKVDRGALPVPGVENSAGYLAPRSAVEEVLTGIWKDILELARVGVHDDFFELGGNSLLATRLIFRLNEAFQVALSLRHLFESPTVAELAERIETVRWVVHGQQMVSLQSSVGAVEREVGEL